MATKYTVAATLTANSKPMIAAFAAARAAAERLNASLAATSKIAASTAASVNTSGKTMGTAFVGAHKGAKDASSSIHTVGKSADTANGSVRNLGRNAAIAGAGFGTVSNASSLAARDLDRFNRMGRGVSMTAMGIGAALVGTVGVSVKQFVAYENALAGVAKTTNATDRELRSFDLAFRKMSRSIPATYEEIANVAEISAQLGVESKSITKFTDTMIRMGTSTNLSAEDASMALARMMNIMGTAQGDVDRLGSVIVKMGNVSATTEQDIVNMAMRIAGMGKSLNMTEADVIALATSLSEVGIRAEMGGSAISTIMSKTASAISRNTESGQKWAEVMGMSVKDVQQLFEKDAYGAFIKMVEGLEKVKASGGNVDKTLRELGTSEIRQLDVMKRLVGRSDELAQAQRTANGEWQTNNALMKESEQRYETFGSQIKMVWNGIKNIFANIGGAFAKSSDSVLFSIKAIVDHFEKLTDSFFDAEGNITSFGKEFVNTMTRITGAAAGLSVVGVAFMAFGPAGAIVAGVVVGLGVILVAFRDLFKYVERKLDTSNFTRAMDDIKLGLSGATKGQAENFIKMRNDINDQMIGMHNDIKGVNEKTKAQMIADTQEMTNEMINEINKSENRMLSTIERLSKTAGSTSKKALEGVNKEVKAHFDMQRAQVANSQAAIVDILTKASNEKRSLTQSEYSSLSAIFGNLDKMYGSHVSKNIGELNKLDVAFGKLSRSSNLKDIQSNVDKFAKSSIKTMDSLSDAYRRQTEEVETLGLSKEAETLILSELEREYLGNTKGILNNLAAYESRGKELNENVDILKNLTEEERRQLGIHKDLTDTMVNVGTASDIMKERQRLAKHEVKDLGSAIENTNGKFNKAQSASENLAQAYLDMGRHLGSVKSAFNEISTASDAAARDVGERFVSTVENGVKMVDLGTAGKMKVDEFVQGIKSGKVTVEQAGVAQINALRNQIGMSSLSPEGEKKITEFTAGLRNKEYTISDVANKLGVSLKSGMEVDLGESGKISIDQFASGLQTGEYSVAEVMLFYQDRLKTLAESDLTNVGQQNINTLKQGIELGFLSAEQVVASFEPRIKEGAKADLTGVGTITMESLATGFKNGQISIDTFLVGLQELTKSKANVDLSPEGAKTVNSLSRGMEENKSVVFKSGDNTKQAVKDGVGIIDLNPKGAAAMDTLSGGIANNTDKPKTAANNTKNAIEQTLGGTSDGNGGAKAALDMAAKITGKKPLVNAASFGIKRLTESVLGSTTDNNGGAKAGGKFASGVNSKTGASRNAASSNKTAVQSVLGSATDGGGGNKAGQQFVTGVNSKTGAAHSAGSGVANAGRGGLQSGGSTYSLGAFFGDGFVNGIASRFSAAANAAASLVSAALSAIQKRQRSNSPAKETISLGIDFGDGYAIGGESSQSKVAKSAQSLVDTALNTVAKAGSIGMDIGVNTAAIAGLQTRGLSEALSAEVGAKASVELSERQPAYIYVDIGGQQFRQFSENIYDENRRLSNVRELYDV